MFTAQHEEVVVCLAGASTIGLILTHERLYPKDTTQRGVKANHSILNFRIPFYECKLPANVSNIIFIDMKYLPPVTQQCIVVCYESVRFQVDNLFHCWFRVCARCELVMKE